MRDTELLSLIWDSENSIRNSEAMPSLFSIVVNAIEVKLNKQEGVVY